MANEIKPEQVPDEVCEAFILAWINKPTRNAIAAALNAWPGMRKDWTSAFADEVALILPLTQTQEDCDDAV